MTVNIKTTGRSYHQTTTVIHVLTILKKGESTYTQSADQANVLNSQFQSVFSIRSPLDLYKLCHSALLNGAASLISLLPDDIQCKFPVSDIEISVNGVAKLLSNLNSAKAASPDAIRPIVLNELSNVIAPIVTAIFQKSLDTGKIPSDWKKAQVCPLFKKGNKQDPAIYRPVFCARLWSTSLLLVSQNTSTRIISYTTFNTAFVTEGHVKLSFCNGLKTLHVT